MVIGIQTRNSRKIPKELRVWIPITKTVTSLDSYYQNNYLVSALPRRYTFEGNKHILMEEKLVIS